jgi:hypothetical protein
MPPYMTLLGLILFITSSAAELGDANHSYFQ